MGRIRNAITKLKNSYAQRKRRSKLKYKDFTIISNNCWAGTAVYKPFGLKYNTPTVGLFIMDEDYMRFLQRLEWYLDQPLKFIRPLESRYYDTISNHGQRPTTYPIAVIGKDVEVHFLHYQDEAEASSKWNRRVKRINFERLLVKMSLRDGSGDYDAMIQRFKSLPYRHSVCFSPIPDKEGDARIVCVPELQKLNIVGGDETSYTLSKINIVEFLNSLE